MSKKNQQEVIQQQALTHYQDMEKLRGEVATLFPFAEVRLVKSLYGIPCSFVSVHYYESCIMTVDRDKLLNVERFVHEYFLNELKNHGISVEDLEVLKRQKGNTND